jgi:hypothetical protein
MMKMNIELIEACFEKFARHGFCKIEGSHFEALHKKLSIAGFRFMCTTDNEASKTLKRDIVRFDEITN